MATPDEETLIVQNTVATNLLEVVGTGIAFPLNFTGEHTLGTFKASNAGDRIQQAIHIILATRIGERPFNPEFGSRLTELVFEQNDAILERLLVFYTAEALRRWEKRIEILGVTIINDYNDDRNTIGVHIQYTIRNSHIQGSFVYPFVREGMETGNLYTGVEATRMLNRGSTVE